MLIPTKVLAGARAVVEFVFELERAELGTLEKLPKSIFFTFGPIVLVFISLKL